MNHSLIGQEAPDASIPDQEGKQHSIADYRGKYVLLYFYPKDDTPGCTTQACTLRDAMNELSGSDIQVLGVSADSVEDHAKFAAKHQLNFPLLADTERQLIGPYDVWKKKMLFGKEIMGIMRDSFLIDPDGVVVKYYHKVTPAKHAKEVLADVHEFKSNK